MRELTQTYVPHPALRLAYQRFFDHIQVDPAWVKAVRERSVEGTVVYVLRNLNFIDFLALDYLTKRYDLPQIRYVNDLGLWILNPLGKGWLNAIRPRRDVTPSDELSDAIKNGGTAALFLKRPPNVRDLVSGTRSARGLKEGDELVQTLFELQRTSERPLLLVPQVFVWTKQPDTLGMSPLDAIFGSREWPSPLRTLAQFFYNYRHVELKAGEPLNVKEFLATNNGASDPVLVRRMTYAMLRRLERERHSVTGPLQKAPDRVRHEIVRGPRLQELINDLSAEKPAERAKIVERALDMLKELQATPELGAVKGMEVVFRSVFNRIYAGIDYDAKDIERLRAVAREGTLILLPSHKSHSDYLILSYIFNEQNLPLPLIAAGDNLNFFPLGTIFRRAGAFFIRRSFKGDRLYATVVDAYIRRLIRDGFPIELFLEGGRSRNGKLLPPKFGLLSMIMDAALAVPQRKTFFVPVSIGYERVIEASTYERELSGAEKRKEDAAGLLQTPKILRHKYGRINMQVGQILSLSELSQELGIVPDEQLRPAKRRALVTRLGNRVMDEINRVTAVTPGTLTALALLSHRGRGISHLDFVEQCARLLDALQSGSARISPAMLRADGSLHPGAIRESLQMFLNAELVDAYAGNSDGEPTLLESFRGRRRSPGVNETSYYAVKDGRRLVLDTSKNMIVHFFVERGLVSVAALAAPGLPAEAQVVRERVRQLSRLFKFEFRFRADASFEEIFGDTVDSMQRAGHLGREGDRLTEGPGSHGLTGKSWLEDYSAILRNFLEGYRVAARALSLLVRGPMAEKDLVKRALSLGNRMYLAGEIERREAVSKPLIENALLAFADLGYVKNAGEKVELLSAFSSAETVRTIETELVTFLGEREERA